MSQNCNFAYFPPTPNYPGDNNNSSNTIDSQNHNTSLLNNNNSSFNNNNNNNSGYFYANTIVVITNNTSNEIGERSAVEIARRIPETLPPPWVWLAKWEMLPRLSTNRHISRFPLVPPNPESILREDIILERFQTQGGQRSRLPLTDNAEREITIAVMGRTRNIHACPKPAVY